MPAIARRDIKPENLLLTENGRIKVCDLVRSLRPTGPTVPATSRATAFAFLLLLFLTPSGRVQGLARTQNKMNYMTIAGSDDYMAPEVLLGEKYDEKCDVFGFGVLLGGTASAAIQLVASHCCGDGELTTHTIPATVIVARKKMPMRKEKTHYAFDLRAVEKLIPPGCTPFPYSLSPMGQRQ